MAFIVAALALAGVIVWIARDRARRLIYPPHNRPVQSPDEFELTGWQDLCFRSSDGLTLAGWFVPPAPESDGATVVYVHGLASNRGHMLSRAALMSRHGYGALLIDLRNCGDSEGTMTTLGYREPLDVVAAVDYLLTRPDVNPDRIALYGLSLGAAACIRAAAVTPNVRAVVAEAGFSSLEENVAEGVRRLIHLPPFPFAPLVIFFAQRELGAGMDAVRPVDDVGKIAPRPLLLIHGAEDRLFNPANSQRLFDAAGEPKALWIVPGARHADLLDVAAGEFEARVSDFLARAMGEVLPSPPAPYRAS